MKELFEVNQRYYVIADDELEAESISTFPGDVTKEVFKAEGVDHEWWDCLPFGDDDTDRTCGEILTELRAIRGK